MAAAAAAVVAAPFRGLLLAELQLLLLHNALVASGAREALDTLAAAAVAALRFDSLS